MADSSMPSASQSSQATHKYFLPLFTSILMASGIITSFVSSYEAKQFGYSALSLGTLLSTLIVIGPLSKSKMSIFTIVLVIMFFLGNMGISIFLLVLYWNHKDQLVQTEELGEKSPIRTYEMYVSISLLVMSSLMGKVMYDAVGGSMMDTIELTNMTSMGWLLLVIVVGLLGQMYNVITNYLTDGFIGYRKTVNMNTSMYDSPQWML